MPALFLKDGCPSLGGGLCSPWRFTVDRQHLQVDLQRHAWQVRDVRERAIGRQLNCRLVASGRVTVAAFKGRSRLIQLASSVHHPVITLDGEREGARAPRGRPCSRTDGWRESSAANVTMANWTKRLAMPNGDARNCPPVSVMILPT